LPLWTFECDEYCDCDDCDKQHDTAAEQHDAAEVVLTVMATYLTIPKQLDLNSFGNTQNIVPNPNRRSAFSVVLKENSKLNDN
jgi:hypothetical protein